MNLIIDAGNTQVKLAVFCRGRLEEVSSVDIVDFKARLQKTIEGHPGIKWAIVSDVGGLSIGQRQMVSLYCEVHVLSPSSKVPFKNSYASPQTLGVDRLALATAAYMEYSNTNVLVIDVGSCITYDFLNDYGEYLGGAISPGLNMRYRAMHQQTAKLPALEKMEVIDFIGNTTANCMHSGVVNGTVQEIFGCIEQYRKRFKDLTVILTGGDSQFFVSAPKKYHICGFQFPPEGA